WKSGFQTVDQRIGITFMNSPGSRSSLSDLQPLDTRSFAKSANLWLVWGSVLLAWVVSLLSWRLWTPAPNLLLLVLAFWCLYEPRRVNLFTAFLFG
ncbi:rod shape-determining protein MreD, partial [Escherichia coli]|uniref:rod shape-determining protein MreD n=1 Tax=Escherichia coli TaxID=562 RepID=UPI00307A394C